MQDDRRAEIAPPVVQVGSAPIQPESAAEVDEVFRAMRAPFSTRWLLGRGRIWHEAHRVDANTADRILNMDFEDVLSLLRSTSAERARSRRSRIFFGIAIVLLLVIMESHREGMPWWVKDLLWGTGAGLFTMGATTRQIAASLAIARFDDVRAIGPLAEALELKDVEVARIAAKALVRILPRMKASDAGLLSTPQRACLNRALERQDIRLILAILKAWEQVGDLAAIPAVQSLAEERGWGGRSREVVSAARVCLPALRESGERLQTGSQLLRPSAPGNDDTRSLLRPLTAPAHTPPAQMLRASGDPDA